MAVSRSVEIDIEGQPPEGVRPTLYAYDEHGRLLHRSPVDRGEVELSLPDEVAGRRVRLVVAPDTDEERPKIGDLIDKGGVERPTIVDDRLERPRLDIREPDLERWLQCSCVVRGRVVQRVTKPDGTTELLPVCNARVIVCEVDRLPGIVWRLPDDIIWDIRDDILDLEPDWPPFPPRPPRRRLPGRPQPPPRPLPPRRDATRPRRRDVAPRRPSVEGDPQLAGPVTRKKTTQELSSAVETASSVVAGVDQQSLVRLALQTDVDRVREQLVALGLDLVPILCLRDHLFPFWRYTKDCLAPVEVDSSGRFRVSVSYPCFGDQPDIHVSVEQDIDGSPTTIYSPSLACGTHWDYDCGEELTITVDDPRAETCYPPPDIELPDDDVAAWVMPFAVGNTQIWGDPAASPSEAGWVRPDGFTDHGSVTDAPFAKTLALHHMHSLTIPYSGAYYFLYSYRRVATPPQDWVPITKPVQRHYVVEEPGKPVKLPTVQLGPEPNGLFRFQPNQASDIVTGAPSGADIYWPLNPPGRDRFSGFADTSTFKSPVTPVTGDYEIKLEVFDDADNLVHPDPSTFEFLVPTTKGDTIHTRKAQPSELDNGAFVFRVHVDNHVCQAELDDPTINPNGDASTADDCGFLNYDDKNDTVELAFEASHPNGHATFNIRVVRGHEPVAVLNAGGEVDAHPVGEYENPSNDGDFSTEQKVGKVLNDCTNAAFAAELDVHAKATDGFNRIREFDAHDLMGFALAEEDDG